jgi:hypothetical protein
MLYILLMGLGIRLFNTETTILPFDIEKSEEIF